MTIGVVNDDLEALATIQVKDHLDECMGIAAAIDTGFSGALTLSSEVIDKLGLVELTPTIVRLANHTTATVRRYQAQVHFGELETPIRALAIDAEPLIGTVLLNGNRLTIEYFPGGSVFLETINGIKMEQPGVG